MTDFSEYLELNKKVELAAYSDGPNDAPQREIKTVKNELKGEWKLLTVDEMTDEEYIEYMKDAFDDVQRNWSNWRQ